MHTDENVVKGVKFSEDTKDTPTFTPLAKPPISALRKVWFQRCRKGEYEQLKRELAFFEERGLSIEKLFQREGRVLLDWALIKSPKANPFHFICENVSNDLLQAILAEENYSLLNSFLLGETGVEEYSYIDEVRLGERLNKLKLLLEISSEGIKKFLKASLLNSNIGEGVKASLTQVLVEVNSKQSYK